MTHAHLVFAARDDLAGEYVPAQYPSGGGGGGGPNFWRVEYTQGFLPNLAAAATTLVLDLSEIRWERVPFRAHDADPVRVDPLAWTIQVPLALRRRANTGT